MGRVGTGTMIGLGILGAAGALAIWDRHRRSAPGAGSVPLLPLLPPLLPRAPAPEPAPAGAGAGGQGARPPSIEAWSAHLAPLCLAAQVQLPYALQWMQIESGGNPCEIGYPPARGEASGPWADFPREIGIAQLYNPDDLQKLGVTAPQLRAYCEAGDQHETTYKGRKVRGFSQRLSRPLTEAEIDVQARTLVDKIREATRTADRDLAAVRSGRGWSPDRQGYWALVKLQHAFPELSHQGLPAVAKRLGRAPADWREFRAQIDRVRLSSAIERSRAEFPHYLDNAQKCASAFVEPAIG